MSTRSAAGPPGTAAPPGHPFPSGSASTVRGSAPVCPMSVGAPPARASVQYRRHGPPRWGEVEMRAVLDRLGTGHRPEADAEESAVVSADEDLTLTLGENLPSESWVQNRASSGRSWAVNNDVMQSDRHAVSMRGPTMLLPAPALFCGPGCHIEPTTRSHRTGLSGQSASSAARKCQPQIVGDLNRQQPSSGHN